MPMMKIDFGASFGDIFTTRDKWMSILLLSVCMLIPIVGQIVIYGYLFRRFARLRIGKAADDFNFDHFVEYLTLGAWPFLSAVVASLALTPVAMLAFLPMMTLPMMDPESNVALFVGMIALASFLYFVAIMLMVILTMPIMLRSGLKVDFAAGFSWSFIRDFLRRVGWSLTGWYLLLMLISFPLTLVGMLALYVGLYVAATWTSFASLHLLFQHYDLYLDRGGEPVEFANELVCDFGVAPPPSPATPPPLPGN